MQGKQRLEWLDAMRGFTMILVVAYHVGQMCFGMNLKTSTSMPFGMEGGHDLDAEPTGHDDLEEVQDSGHPYDCVPDSVPRGEGEGILACHGACDGFANEERILVHVGTTDYVRDLLCVRLL